MVELLEHLFQKTPPLAIDTIRGYRSALSSTLYNVMDLTNSVFLRNLLKNMDVQHPKYKELCPKWNLALVLAYITSPPFEPIMKASLWHLTLKTVFLLKLASGQRRNELHALSCDERCHRFWANGGLVTLITAPGFLGKNQKPQDSTPWIVIPALGLSVGDHPDRKLCPVRVLKAYLERTKELEVRRGRTRLFLNPKKPESDISPAHISIWIKKLVQDAHEHARVKHLRLAKVTAHDVRKFLASWAAFNGAPFNEIMQAAYWKSQTTFTSFYLKAMATQAKGLFALGPIVVAQTVIQPPGTSSDEEEGIHSAVPLLPSGD